MPACKALTLDSCCPTVNAHPAAPLRPLMNLQLLHNWTQLHMRTAFEDHPVRAGALAVPSALPVVVLLVCTSSATRQAVRLYRFSCRQACIQYQCPQVRSSVSAGHLLDTCWLSPALPCLPALQGFENRRHLLRLHLTPEDARPLDPAGRFSASLCHRHILAGV